MIIQGDMLCMNYYAPSQKGLLNVALSVNIKKGQTKRLAAANFQYLEYYSKLLTSKEQIQKFKSDLIKNFNKGNDVSSQYDLCLDMTKTKYSDEDIETARKNLAKITFADSERVRSLGPDLHNLPKMMDMIFQQVKNDDVQFPQLFQLVDGVLELGCAAIDQCVESPDSIPESTKDTWNTMHNSSQYGDLCWGLAEYYVITEKWQVAIDYVRKKRLRTTDSTSQRCVTKLLPQ